MDGVILLIVVCTAGFILLGAWSVSTSVAARSTTRRSLDMMASYDTVNVRDEEMLEPLADRVLVPVARWLTEIARKFTPAGYIENVRKKMVIAGNPPGYEVDRLLVLKVLGLASGVVWVPLAIYFFSGQPLFAILAVVVAWGGAFMLPDLRLDDAIKRRRTEIERSLSDTLDLLVISVEAGLGFEQALDRTADTVPGPLSDELRRMLQETRMGASRADALRALDERTEVDDLKTFIVAMLQADTFGVSVSRILRTQADEIRTRRRQFAQEKAQQAPIKMLFPLVFCIFPAIFVVLLVPALIQVFNKF
jgi:tight adherence protein C